MSFKGIVTRKDKETGVDLLAKIVTENKKKSAKKTYKVRVASNGLSDTESCSRAVILKKDEVSKAGPGGADDLTVSINLNALGAFGTTLTYKITNDNPECPLTDYLSANGTLLGSPVFGAGDATGKLYITASKGDASITAIVPITVKAYTAESILYNESLVSKDALWTAMTTNPKYTMTTNDKITFLADWEPWKLLPVKPSTQKIQLAYTVDDRASAGIGQARIDSNTAGTKTVFRPSYSTLKALEDSSPEFEVSEYKDPNQAGKTAKSLKCSGLVVSVTLTLGDASIVFEYDITTRSAPLTNQEVVDALEGLAEAPTPRGNKASSVLKLYNADDLGAELGGYFMNALAPTERSGAECYNINATALDGELSFNIKCITGSDFETLVKLDSLGLAAGDISAEISEPQIFAFNGTDTYCDDAGVSNSVFGPKEGAVLAENVVPVNLDLIKSMIDTNAELEEAATAFAVFQKISFTKYEGLPKSMELMKWFYITNIDSIVV